jgi:hypothetical protein
MRVKAVSLLWEAGGLLHEHVHHFIHLILEKGDGIKVTLLN